MLGRFTEVTDYFSVLGVPAQVLKSLSTQFRLISVTPSEILLVQGAQQVYGYFIMSGILRACH
jgi:CRP-like cAMP-binding protein